MALLPLPGNAQTDGASVTGNKMLVPCRNWASAGPVPPALEALDQGMCGGIVSSIFYYGSGLPIDVRFCAPKGANQGQALRIIVKYLLDNPAITNRDFRELAAEALHKAWPCAPQ
jgi:hypothetical protein